MSSAPPNALSVDVEEWYEAFDQPIDPCLQVSRVRIGLDRILQRLAHHRHTATFFVLGSLAERDPGTVRDIAAAGHRIACHGLRHHRMSAGSRSTFREEIRRALDILRDQSGQAVIGFRAPWFSLGHTWTWAHEELLEAGIRYDSSLFPVANPFYGSFGVDPGPHPLLVRETRTLWEIPPAPTRLGPLPFPAAGGLYGRVMPLAWMTGAIDRWNRAGGRALLYTHPWELDPDQPQVRTGLLDRLIHYTALPGWGEKLERILSRFTLTSIEAAFADLGAWG